MRLLWYAGVSSNITRAALACTRPQQLTMLTYDQTILGLDRAGHRRHRLCLQPACQLLLGYGLSITEQP